MTGETLKGRSISVRSALFPQKSYLVTAQAAAKPNRVRRYALVAHYIQNRCDALLQATLRMVD